MSTQTPCFIGIVITYFQVNIFKKIILAFIINYHCCENTQIPAYENL